MQTEFMAKSITTEMIFTGIMHIRQESARAVPQDAYVLNYEKEIDMEAGANYRLEYG